MTKFEFKFVEQPDHAHAAEELLTRLGREGWSLAAKDYGCFIMQREAQTAGRGMEDTSDQPLRRV